jgi:nicotinate phosphoribosyltransferase
MPPIIQSLLETDLYKFTMWQAMLHRHPATQAEYTFVCRNQSAYPLAELVNDVQSEIDHLCSLSFTADELKYLASLRYMKSDFIDFLRIFRFQREFISVKADGATLKIVACGPQVHVMGFEIFVLAIVNELYFRRFDRQASEAEGRQRLKQKVVRLKQFSEEAPCLYPFEFFDFGVRRRFSGTWQREVVSTLKEQIPQYFVGPAKPLQPA